MSWRLQVKGQNRAVCWKASDRKCHFNLSTAAAKPGLAYCPAQHVTFSSPSTRIDVKTINFTEFLAWPYLISSVLHCLSSACFVSTAHWQRLIQTPFTFIYLFFKVCWHFVPFFFFNFSTLIPKLQCDSNVPLQKNHAPWNCILLYFLHCTGQTIGLQTTPLLIWWWGALTVWGTLSTEALTVLSPLSHC